MKNQHNPKSEIDTHLKPKLKREISIILTSLVLTTGIFAARNENIDIINNKQDIELKQPIKNPETVSINFDKIDFNKINKNIGKYITLNSLACNEIIIEKNENETRIKFKIYAAKGEKNNVVYLDGTVTECETEKTILEMKSFIERTGKNILFLELEGKVIDSSTIDIYLITLKTENETLVLIFKNIEIEISKN
ncbi:MAG: hypothetical protein WC356_01000 [Candidatus Micrarchaeia archaeon]|jgi:hypothetical protein